MGKANESGTSQQFKAPTSMKIGYVSLNVSDLDRSLEFYQSVLGFETISKPSSDRAVLSAGSTSHLIELQNVKTEDSYSTSRAGLYHFAILLPERKHLANLLRDLSEKAEEVHFDGLADHLVSESIYIHDPDHIGIEIYRDRPVTEWKTSGGKIQMATLPIDTDDLLRETTDKGWKGMPEKTTIGHVHLRVTDIEKATKFYGEILGLNLTATIPGAAFFAAGNYHHHIGANTWLGEGIARANSRGIGLNHFSIDLQDKQEYQEMLKQLSQHGMRPSGTSERAVFVHDLDGIRTRIQYK